MFPSKRPESVSWHIGGFPPASMFEVNPAPVSVALTLRNQKALFDLAPNLGPPQGDRAVRVPVLLVTLPHFCPPLCPSAPPLI